jgi:hypothetical protein
MDHISRSCLKILQLYECTQFIPYSPLIVVAESITACQWNGGAIPVQPGLHQLIVKAQPVPDTIQHKNPVMIEKHKSCVLQSVCSKPNGGKETLLLVCRA